MENMIKDIRKSGLKDIKVIVRGVSVTQDFADKKEADAIPPMQVPQCLK